MLPSKISKCMRSHGGGGGGGTRYDGPYGEASPQRGRDFTH